MASLEGELLPWISMAEALGWGMTARPFPVVASGRETGGPDKEKVGGSGARKQIYDEKAPGRWALDPRASMGEGMIERHGPREPVPETEPAPVITEKARSAEWKSLDQRQQSSGDGSRERRQRDVEEPAPTIVGESRNDSWTAERPATAVCGDPRLAPPGYRGRAEDYKDGGKPDGQFDNSVRVSIEEAAVLQGFPPDYPWQGSRTKQFQQIGNAVPPPLAQAILGSLAGTAELGKAA